MLAQFTKIAYDKKDRNKKGRDAHMNTLGEEKVLQRTLCGARELGSKSAAIFSQETARAGTLTN